MGAFLSKITQELHRAHRAVAGVNCLAYPVDAPLGKNPALYGQDVVQGLKITEPPVNENDVAEFLGYDIQEVGRDEVIDFIKYKTKEVGQVGEEEMMEWQNLGKSLQTACAHLSKRANLILVSRDMHRLRKRTSVFHECGHDRTPRHSMLDFSCTENALEPVYHRRIEREAFLCGVEIQMPRQLFVSDALDLPLSVDAMKALAKRYDASLETTAIHYAQTNRRICAIVVVEPSEDDESATTILDHEPLNQLAFPYRRECAFLPVDSGKHLLAPLPLRVKYCVKSPRFPKYIPPGTGITEGNPIFNAWNSGIALQDELPTSVFGFWTKEVYHADIFPLGNTGMVMALLWLPDRQLVQDSRWEIIP